MFDYFILLAKKSISNLSIFILITIAIFPITTSAQPSKFVEKNTESITAEAYLLGAGDRLFVDFFKVPEYSKEYQILVDGTLNLPLLGRIEVRGLTLTQVSKKITKLYKQKGLLTNPIIVVNLVAPRPINVSVVGSVRSAGTYQVKFKQDISGGIQFPTLTDALTEAKGITAAADLRQVRVIRSQYQRQEQVFSINLWDFLQNGDLSQNLVLRDGDRIVVPYATTIDREEVRQRATANFSANLNVPITVTIIGEVNRPGPYTLSGSDLRSSNQNDSLSFDGQNLTDNNNLAGLPTVTRAIKFAGGITAKANLRNIQVSRSLPGGEQQLVNVDLWNLLKTGNLGEDALLQDGDRIIIPAVEAVDVAEARQLAVASFSPNAIGVNIVGEIKKPGNLNLPPNSSLQQAILAAGGFDNRRAQEGNVELIRLNSNGTVERRKIAVNFSQPLNEQNNPILLNNDVVFVERSELAKGSDSIFSFLEPLTQIFNFGNLIKSVFDITF